MADHFLERLEREKSKNLTLVYLKCTNTNMKNDFEIYVWLASWSEPVPFRIMGLFVFIEAGRK